MPSSPFVENNYYILELMGYKVYYQRTQRKEKNNNNKKSACDFYIKLVFEYKLNYEVIYSSEWNIN